MQRLKLRRDFVAASKAAYQSTPGIVVQARNRDDSDPPRVGFTCTKKLGNAVIRNRIRRRMREAVRLAMAAHAKPGYDYVLIGRSAAENRTFEALQKDIISALDRLHAKTSDGRNRTP
jgi:ribonuclease P protein component